MQKKSASDHLFSHFNSSSIECTAYFDVVVEVGKGREKKGGRRRLGRVRMIEREDNHSKITLFSVGKMFC